MSTEERSKYANILGEMAEKFCFLEALKRGAEVYPNFIKVGRTDVIMKIYGKLYEFDVKAGWFNETRGEWEAKRCNEVKLPQWPILVEMDPLRCRWVNYKGKKKPRCPQGLEDLWD